jgi:hypothetical protein
MDEEFRSTARKVRIPTTPIILSYLVENRKATRNDITKVVCELPPAYAGGFLLHPPPHRERVHRLFGAFRACIESC